MLNFPSFFNGVSAPYEIEQSLRFNSADSAYLNRTPGSAGNRKTWTWSGWVKRCSLANSAIFSAGTADNARTLFYFDQTNGQLYFFNSASGTVTGIFTSAYYRDASAWYHLVLSVDTTQATASNRAKIYINGVEQVVSNYVGAIAQNTDLYINNTNAHGIGAQAFGTAIYSNQYLAEVNFIDGSALDHEDFGELDDNGVWRPIKYAGSYTGNSFYLKFDAADVDGDSSGLGNDWTASAGISTSGTGTDVMSDTPTTNWCTLNPLYTQTAGNALSNGNLTGTGHGGASNRTHPGTIGVNQGQWYWEWTTDSVSNGCGTGIMWQTNEQGPVANAQTFSHNPYDQQYLSPDGVESYGTGVAAGDVFGCAFDLDDGTIEFFRNGTSLGEKTNVIVDGRTYFPFLGVPFPETNVYSANFGQRAFAYTPPTNFLPLNTSNLSAPDIADGSEYFNTVLYSGNGSTQSITGVGFKPDLVWFKSRNSNYHGALVDQVRGATKYWYSSLAIAEETQTTALSTFDSDGFSLNGSFSNVNNNGTTYVAWNWLAANGTSNIAAGSIDGTNPTIASTVSANPSAGFSIVTFSSDGTTAGGTAGHGLGVAPKMVIYKGRNTTENWHVYHAEVGPNSAVFLNLTNSATATGTFNNTNPTSSVIQLKQTSWGAGNLVAYCFAEVEGYSKFGSYVGNGSVSGDGPFVWCGFRPKLILMKSSTNSATPWQIFDSVREPENTVEQTLIANGPSSEPYDTASPVDFLSNGFKLRGGASSYNNYNTGTWIFAAFAEHPFGGNNVSPATAR